MKETRSEILGRKLNVSRARSGEVTGKQCSAEGCDKPAKPHRDNGLSCGDDMCDEHFEEMRRECRERSW